MASNHQIVNYSEMQECESIPFDVILRWTKVCRNFRFCSSVQTAKDLIDNGTTRSIDAYAVLAAMPDLVAANVSTQIGGPISNKQFMETCLDSYVSAIVAGDTTKEGTWWGRLSRALGTLTEENKENVACAFYDRLYESLHRGVGSSDQEILVVLLRARTMTARDSAWAGLPKVGNEHYSNTDSSPIIAYGLQVEDDEERDRQTKMLMSAMTYIIMSLV